MLNVKPEVLWNNIEHEKTKALVAKQVMCIIIQAVTCLLDKDFANSTLHDCSELQKAVLWPG